MRGLVCTHLRGDGFQVLEASSDLEALLVLRRGTVGIALLAPSCGALADSKIEQTVQTSDLRRSSYTTPTLGLRPRGRL